MGYDKVLAGRVRDLADPGMQERSVFGARCWLLDGNMAYGVHEDDLLVRLPPDQAAPGTTPFDPMGHGKPMKGWFLVSQDDVAEDDALLGWMERAQSYAAALPPK